MYGLLLFYDFWLLDDGLLPDAMEHLETERIELKAFELLEKTLGWSRMQFGIAAGNRKLTGNAS